MSTGITGSAAFRALLAGIPQVEDHAVTAHHGGRLVRWRPCDRLSIPCGTTHGGQLGSAQRCGVLP